MLDLTIGASWLGQSPRGALSRRRPGMCLSPGQMARAGRSNIGRSDDDDDDNLSYPLWPSLTTLARRLLVNGVRGSLSYREIMCSHFRMSRSGTSASRPIQQFCSKTHQSRGAIYNDRPLIRGVRISDLRSSCIFYTVIICLSVTFVIFWSRLNILWMVAR